jgi:hypothetical protein
MPRKPIKKKQSLSDTNNNRVRNIVKNLIGNEKPDDLMIEIINVLEELKIKPSVGNYYTFFYNPKTSGITYDEYPLVAVTDIFPWGFRGINFHWEKIRQYTWDEINGRSLYQIRPEEMKDMRKIPFSKIRINN